MISLASLALEAHQLHTAVAGIDGKEKVGPAAELAKALADRLNAAAEEYVRTSEPPLSTEHSAPSTPAPRLAIHLLNRAWRQAHPPGRCHGFSTKPYGRTSRFSSRYGCHYVELTLDEYEKASADIFKAAALAGRTWEPKVIVAEGKGSTDVPPVETRDESPDTISIIKQAAEQRGSLLLDFVYHWRRGNLLPYEDRFREIMEERVLKAEEHFDGPVDPMAPMPNVRCPWLDSAVSSKPHSGDGAGGSGGDDQPLPDVTREMGFPKLKKIAQAEGAAWQGLRTCDAMVEAIVKHRVEQAKSLIATKPQGAHA